MGFHRHIQPPALDRAALRAVVVEFIGEREIVGVLATADPFGLDHDCLNPSGHDFIASCGDVVCCHCGKVVWS